MPKPVAKADLKKLQQQLITASDSGMLATTVRLADQYLLASPGSVRALIDKAHALAGLARYEEALTAYQSAIDALEEDQSPDAIYGEIGNLYRAQGDFERASTYYQKQIDTDPDDATGYLFLGTLQLLQGDISKSGKTLKRGSACPGGVLDELTFALGVTLRAAGEYQAAANCFSEVLRASPNDAHAKAALKDVRQAIQ